MRASYALRGFAACGAILAASAPLGGCGSAQDGSVSSTVASRGALARGGDRAARQAALAKASTGSPRHLSLRVPAARASAPVSLAAAEAFARAINLTASDVPGAVAHERESHSKSPREKRAFAKCLGVQPAREIVEVKSPQLDRGRGIEGESFTSSVTVVAHPPEAEREIEGVRRFHGQPCLGHLLRRSLLDDSRGRARLDALHISSLPAPVLGADVSAGLRIEFTLRTARGTAVRFYTDELAFAVGPAEVQLGAFSVAQPVALTTERQLLSLLAQRARADPL